MAEIKQDESGVADVALAETEKDETAVAEATKDVTLLKLITEGKNPRGIPSAKFIVCSGIMCGKLVFVKLNIGECRGIS